MDHAERVAQAVVEALEPGSQMVPRAVQSHGEHDFDLVHPDGSVAALEVTAAIDAQAQGTRAAIRAKKKGGPFVRRVTGTQGWILHPASNASINLIRAKADEYLLAIEAEGLTRFFAPTDTLEHESVGRILCDLGVEAGSVMQWKTPRTIGIAVPSQGGLVSLREFLVAVATEATKADNLRKLRAAATPERHLFVYVHPSNFLAWAGFVDADPPIDVLALPEPITHLWAATESGSPSEYVVWQARRGSRWRRLGPLSLAVSQGGQR